MNMINIKRIEKLADWIEEHPDEYNHHNPIGDGDAPCCALAHAGKMFSDDGDALSTVQQGALIGLNGEQSRIIDGFMEWVGWKEIMCPTAYEVAARLRYLARTGSLDVIPWKALPVKRWTPSVPIDEKVEV